MFAALIKTERSIGFWAGSDCIDDTENLTFLVHKQLFSFEEFCVAVESYKEFCKLIKVDDVFSKMEVKV